MAMIMRSSDQEKQAQIDGLQAFQRAHVEEARTSQQKLQHAALAGENVFGALMVAAKFCSLGQMSAALYDVGGQYRRNM